MAAAAVFHTPSEVIALAPGQVPGGAQFTTGTICQYVPSSVVCQGQADLKKFLTGEPKALGVVQIMIAVALVLLGGIQIVALQVTVGIPGIPFWGAVFYIVSGSLSVAASNYPRSALINGALAMNIFSSVVACIGAVLSGINIVIHKSYDYTNRYNSMLQWSTVSMSMGLSAAMLILSMLELAVAVSTAIFCCKATCCSSSPPHTILLQQVTSQPAPGPVQNVTYPPLAQSPCPSAPLINNVQNAPPSYSKD
ncbi:membrane-spanning 4-domains subfamily A member 4D-like [Lepisosteus oculatus]|uniref:Membrane-spanning 4-domains subfamily A member 4D-like n=1 Tax=Lepisosteus oculatus TaxID=7918 RepID=W5MHR0_LEPOC|nr:PREDICTED: membrane-spanning 4-domains subfamily A member 4D-like [Lepisosteus oculatus]